MRCEILEREGVSRRKVAKEQRECAQKVREEWNWGTIGGRKKGNDEAVSCGDQTIKR